jgi:hypothetical protein
MAFLDFLRRVYDIETQYTGPQSPAPPGGPDGDAGGDLSSLLALFQQGAEGGRPARMGGPMLGGGPGGPVNLAGPPDAGDLVDANNELGGSPLAGLFGSRRPGR